MPEAAELAAHNFIPANFRCREMKLEIQSRHEILMNSQCWNIERVAHVFGVHHQPDFLVHRNGHLGGHDVISGIWIAVGIKAKEVLVGLADLVGVQRAELSVGPGIAEIEGELSGLDLNGQGVSTGRREVDIAPGFYSENSQGKHFDADKYNRGRHQPGCAAGKILRFLAWPAAGESPDEPRQQDLRGEERNSGLPHGFGHLVVNGLTVGRDILHRMPGIANDGNRGKDRDYENGDRKEFCHDASPSVAASVPYFLSNAAAENETPPPSFRQYAFALKVKFTSLVSLPVMVTSAVCVP